MKRAAFTIIYNGLHHLQHNGFAEFMAKNFDYWIVVEGLSSNNGSTWWCNNVNLPKNSTDGTCEFMVDFAADNPNVIYFSSQKGYPSKDNQVNQAVQILSTLTDECWLWQVDADEHWTAAQLEQAEAEMPQDRSLAGGFQFNHYLCKDIDGRQLIAEGEWGSGIHTRLWYWNGNLFESHEPPKLAGQSGVRLLSPRYDHWSYTFQQDIEFKQMYYRGYGNLLRRWNKLKTGRANYPLPITALLGPGFRNHYKNSYINAI